MSGTTRGTPGVGEYETGLRDFASVGDASHFRRVIETLFGFLFKARDADSYQKFLELCSEAGINIPDTPAAKLIYYTVKRSKFIDELNISSALSGSFVDISPARFNTLKISEESSALMLLFIPLVYVLVFLLYAILQSVSQVFKVITPSEARRSLYIPVKDHSFLVGVRFVTYTEKYAGDDVLEGLITSLHNELSKVLGLGYSVDVPPKTAVYTAFDIMMDWVEGFFRGVVERSAEAYKDKLDVGSLVSGFMGMEGEQGVFSLPIGSGRNLSLELLRYTLIIITKFTYKLKQFFRVKIVFDPDDLGSFWSSVLAFFENVFNDFMLKFLEDTVKEVVYNFRPTVDVYGGYVDKPSRQNNPMSFEITSAVRPPQKTERTYPQGHKVVFEHNLNSLAGYVKDGDYTVKSEKELPAHILSSINSKTPPLKKTPLYNILITTFYESAGKIVLNKYYWSFVKENKGDDRDKRFYDFESKPVVFMSKDGSASLDNDTEYILTLPPPVFELVDKDKFLNSKSDKVKLFETYVDPFKVRVPDYALIDEIPIYKGSVFELEGDGVLTTLRVPVFVDSVFEESGLGGSSELFSFSQKLEPTPFNKTDAHLYLTTSIEIDDKTFSSFRFKILFSGEHYSEKALQFLHFLFKYFQNTPAVGDMNVVFMFDFKTHTKHAFSQDEYIEGAFMGDAYFLAGVGKDGDRTEHYLLPIDLYFNTYIKDGGSVLLSPTFYILRSLNISYPTEAIFNYSYNTGSPPDLVFEVEGEVERVQLQRIVF